MYLIEHLDVAITESHLSHCYSGADGAEVGFSIYNQLLYTYYYNYYIYRWHFLPNNIVIGVILLWTWVKLQVGAVGAGGR